jgi:hypothetical protein
MPNGERGPPNSRLRSWHESRMFRQYRGGEEQ